MIRKSTPAFAPVVSSPEGVVEIICNSTNVVDAQRDKILPTAWQGVLNQRPKMLVGHAEGMIPVGKALSLRELMPGDPGLPQWHKSHGAGALVGRFQLALDDTEGARACSPPSEMVASISSASAS